MALGSIHESAWKSFFEYRQGEIPACRVDRELPPQNSITAAAFTPQTSRHLAADDSIRRPHRHQPLNRLPVPVDLPAAAARQTGIPIERLQQMLLNDDHEEALSAPQRIREIHRVWQEKIVARKAVIDAGVNEPKNRDYERDAILNQVSWVQR